MEEPGGSGDPMSREDAVENVMGSSAVDSARMYVRKVLP